MQYKLSCCAHGTGSITTTYTFSSCKANIYVCMYSLCTTVTTQYPQICFHNKKTFLCQFKF